MSRKSESVVASIETEFFRTDNLSINDLMYLNRRLIEAIKSRRAAEAHEKFTIGQKVRFDDRHGKTWKGRVHRIGRTGRLTVHTTEGVTWRVPGSACRTGKEA